MAGSRPPRAAAALLRGLLPEELAPAVLGDLEEEHGERLAESGRLSADAWYWAQLLTLRPLRLRRALRPVADRWHATPWSYIRTLGDGNMLEALVQNLRHTLRRLARSPMFTAAAVLSLALGIGANTAIFTLTNAIFLGGSGVVEPERVVQIYRDSGGPYWRITFEDYRRARDELGDVFGHVMAYREDAVRLGDSDDVTGALRVVGDYFGVMGVQPAMGRAFVPGEETDVEHETGVAILSWDLWQDGFGGDPGIVGREIRVNARPTTVIGVLGEDFDARVTGIEVGLVLPDPYMVTASSDNLWGVARLRPGASVATARAGMERIAADYNVDRPESLRPVAFTVVSQADVRVQPGFDQAVMPMAALLFAVVGVVLLIACANLASFLLARATDRRKEFAVRMAMGAGRGRITAQLLGEALFLGLLGGAGGMLLAYGALDLLLSVQPPLPVAIDLDIAPDWRVLTFTLAVSLGAGVVFGIFPALQAGRSPVAPTLRDESGSTGGRRKWSVRGALVAGQVTMSLVLLMAAGLFLRSLLTAASIDPGFDPDGVAVVTVDPETTGYDEESARRLWDQLIERASAVPGVSSVALGTRIPLQLGNWRSGVQRTDVTPQPGREFHWPQVAMVSPGYLRTLGIEVLRGREFTAEDGADAPPVVVLNEAAVRQIWGEGVDPVGQPLKLSWTEEEGRVVGVARDSKLKTLGEETEALAYLPLAQRHVATALLIARGERGSALPERLRAAAKELDPGLYVHGAMTARESMSTATFLPRMAGILLGTFGALALLMSAIGLYGVVGYTVASREKEVGIRLSLGASADEVVRLMMGGGLRLVMVGLLLGTALAFAAGRAIERFLFGVGGWDPVTFVVVPLVLLGVAALAAWVPARRASRVEPMSTLRSQ